MKAGDIYATLDALKVADTVLFLETAQHWEEGLYPEAELLLTTSMAQGLPSSVVAVMDLESVPKKVFCMIFLKASRCIDQLLILSGLIVL